MINAFRKFLLISVALSCLQMEASAMFNGEDNYQDNLRSTPPTLLNKREEIKAESNLEEKEGKPIPDGRIWIKHVQEDLLPFWTMKEAFGEPVGNFPTFRSNNGTLLSKGLSSELDQAEAWIKQEYESGREFTRMKARRIYFYSFAYHLTGEEKLLSLAKAGIDYIRKNLIDYENYGIYSYSKKGKPGPKDGQQNTQDLSFGLMAFSSYYYLTRDPEILQDILNIKNHIFEKYMDKNWNMLKWVTEEPEDESSLYPIKQTDRKELVSQLDQVNAYMVLVSSYSSGAVSESLETRYGRFDEYLYRSVLFSKP